MKGISTLTDTTIDSILSAITEGRIKSPLNRIILEQVVGKYAADASYVDLEELLSAAGPTGTSKCLVLIKKDRTQRAQNIDALLDLVWTGPEIPGVHNRDTKVVVADLFRSATKSVIISGYSFYMGQEIFKDLAQHLSYMEDFKVIIFMNLSQDHKVTGDELSLAAKRKEEFFRYNWPWPKKPEIYYDPRANNSDNSEKAVLHAKCIIKDSSELYIGSANFSEAAHSRNIEAGVLIRNEGLAKNLEKHFLSLIEANLVKEL